MLGKTLTGKHGAATPITSGNVGAGKEMDQEERGKILSAAVRGLNEELPETPEPETPEPEAEVEAEAQEVEAEPEAPKEPRIPKRRLDEEIRKKREAEEQAAYWKGRAEAVPQPRATYDRDDDEDEDDDNVLSGLDRRLQDMEARQKQVDHRRAVERETERIKSEIAAAISDSPMATAEEVAREMLLDPKVSAVEAAQIVNDRENQREARILKKHSIAKQKKAEAARRPKTTGSPAIAAEEKQPVTRESARRAFADAFSRMRDDGR